MDLDWDTYYDDYSYHLNGDKIPQKAWNEWKFERGWKKYSQNKKKKKRTLIATEIPPVAFYLSYKRQDEY